MAPRGRQKPFHFPNPSDDGKQELMPGPIRADDKLHGGVINCPQITLILTCYLGQSALVSITDFYDFF